MLMRGHYDQSLGRCSTEVINITNTRKASSSVPRREIDRTVKRKMRLNAPHGCYNVGLLGMQASVCVVRNMVVHSGEDSGWVTTQSFAKVRRVSKGLQSFAC